MELHVSGGSVSGWLNAMALVGLVALVLVVAWQHRQGARLRARLTALNSRSGQTAGSDPLTGLPTRAELELTLQRVEDQAEREGLPLTLIYLGIDGMRAFNDGLGHAQGDSLLQQVAQRLSTACGDALVARVAGSEFAVVAHLSLADARVLASRLLAVVARPLSMGTGNAADPTNYSATASVGLACYPEHGARARLVANAIVTMHAVKAAGGNAYADYEPSMGMDHRERVLLRSDLAAAVERRQLELVYQPKVDAHTLRVASVEALLRWKHPKRGLVSPAVFIPLAEQSGQIRDIGNWVIDEACRQAAVWRDNGLRMRVAVNLSAYQIRQDDLVDRIVAALQRNKLVPERFTCEITESTAMEDTQVTRHAFERLRKAGLRISIDDFGTGHSSLAVLRRLPAEELKIDRAFVCDLATSAEARSIAAAIVQMAHSLELRVVAEGVETEAQRDLLIEMGCDQLQGYLFAKPMSAKALQVWAYDDGPQLANSFSDSLFKVTDYAQL